jgi:arylformamidase
MYNGQNTVDGRRETMAMSKTTQVTDTALAKAFAAGRVIDISMALNERTVVWTADPQPKLIPVCRQPEADCNFTWLDFGAHAGTHIDAPYYLYKEKWTCDQIPLNRLIGPCQVLDLTDVDDMITVDDLEKRQIARQIIMIKTRNSFDPMQSYNPNHIAMEVAAAEYLVEQGVTTLGYDYQSFERGGKNAVHDVFLSRSITLVDNLRLEEAEAKEYYFLCLPVKVTGIDGAPARAILIDESA